MRITGYHGTTDNVASILMTQGFNPGISKRPLWLGYGCYFFQDAPARAKNWADFIAGRRKQKPVLLRATLNLTSRVDLIDHQDCALLQTFMLSTQAPTLPAQIGPEAMFRTLPPQSQSQLGWNYADHAMINAFVAYLEQYGRSVPVVRAAFIEGKPFTPTSWLFDQAHVAVCVRDPARVIEKLEVV